MRRLPASALIDLPRHTGEAGRGKAPETMTGEVDESAFAMIGGIAVATFLTLLFLPALYVAWYRPKEPTPDPSR